MSARLAYTRTSPPRRFSRRWFSDGLRTLAWTAVITLLIWVYADIQFTERRDLRATLHVFVNDNTHLVLLSESDVPVVFTVKGNRSQIDQLADRIAASGSICVYDAGKSIEPGDVRKEKVAELLSGSEQFRKGGQGLEIVSSWPRDLDVRLDQLKMLKDVPVDVKSQGAELAEPPVVQEHVAVQMPASKLPEDAAQLRLATEMIDLTSETTGDKPIVRRAKLVAPAAGALLTPREVQVSFRILPQDEKRKFNVTVQVQSPRAWLDNDTWSQYRLLAKDPLEWTRAVSVQGTRTDLEKLKPEDIQAYIVLTDEDKKPDVKSWLPGTVKVQFPPNLKVALAEPVAPVNYRLEKRTEGPPASP